MKGLQNTLKIILMHTLAIIPLARIVYTGESHSLWYFFTLTSGPSPFPELVIIEMVDDFPVGYYDSATKRVIAWKNWQKEEDEVYDPGDKRNLIIGVSSAMKKRLQLLKEHYNQTEGLLTYQRIGGCELDADGTARVRSSDAYNGKVIFEFDSDSRGWYTLIPEIEEEFKIMESQSVFFSKHFFHNWCTSTLLTYLQRLNGLLNQKVHPRVRVIHKQDRDSGEMKVTCLATGFYPRHINLTLQRNGQPVPDQELTRGEPLPNGDGTYQLRKSLSVSAEELRERHLYTCTVTHSSVDNKLDVSWEFQPGHSNLVLYGVSFGVLTALVLTIFGLCIWKKRDAGLKKSHQSHHDESSGASEKLQTEPGKCEGT
ncbi:hypothetical protein MATL_G00250950 [Megalops atlanticus]|uniref:Ig-like domain-containing protein n=1 Tax=Megalops atlanticus TaxID=7932 RepID=A0A9D3PCY5_MEGAT|nr:hypothetical protein MATL_G00250950 [Megalops atlanticus]